VALVLFALAGRLLAQDWVLEAHVDFFNSRVILLLIPGMLLYHVLRFCFSSGRKPAQPRQPPSWPDRLGLPIASTLLLASFVLLLTRDAGVLPPTRRLMAMQPDELRRLLGEHVSVGMSRSEVEQVLRYRIRRTWTMVNYESRQTMAHHGFSAPIARGDYYFYSHLAVEASSPLTANVITAKFLFDANHQLKDFAIRKWGDGP